MITAGLLGRKTGRGFYTYEAPDSPIVVADDATPVGRRRAALRHDIQRVGVVGTGTMATGIVEVFAKGGYDVSYVGRGQDKVDGVAATIERSLDKAVQRGKLEERPRPTCSARLTGTTSLDDLADVDLVVEAVAEDLDGQDRAVREPRRDLQAGRDPGHDHLAPAGGRVRRATTRPQTSSACTSSTRRR